MTGARAAAAPTLADPLEELAPADPPLDHVAGQRLLEVDRSAVVAIVHPRSPPWSARIRPRRGRGPRTAPRRRRRRCRPGAATRSLGRVPTMDQAARRADVVLDVAAEIGDLLHDRAADRSDGLAVRQRRSDGLGPDADLDRGADVQAVRATRARSPEPRRISAIARLDSTEPVSRLVVPMKSATKRVAGRSYSSSGVPSCSTRPACMTAMRSLIVSASSWSWVTYTNVMPTSVWMRLSSSWSCSRSLRSSAPRGSSRRRTLGRFTRARARATRCCWPPGQLARLALLVAIQVDERRGPRRPAG